MNLKKENKQSGGWFEIKIEYNVPAKNWTDYLISSCKNIHVVDVFFIKELWTHKRIEKCCYWIKHNTGERNKSYVRLNETYATWSTHGFWYKKKDKENLQ